MTTEQFLAAIDDHMIEELASIGAYASGFEDYVSSVEDWLWTLVHDGALEREDVIFRRINPKRIAEVYRGLLIDDSISERTGA